MLKLSKCSNYSGNKKYLLILDVFSMHEHATLERES